MTTLKNEYYRNLPPKVLIDHISTNLTALKGVINSKDFDFKESKENLIESIELILKHVSDLEEKI